MRTPRSLSSLLLVLGALTMLAMPASAIAGSQKKAAAASKSSKVAKARSSAAQKGWETRRMNQKAEANWASRIGKDPKADKPGAREAFVRRSVAAQRGWQKRNAAAAAKPGKKSAAVQSGKTSKQASKQAGKQAGKQAAKQKVAKQGKQSGKKKAAKKQSSKKKAAKKQSSKKKGKTASVTPGSEPNMIANAGVGSAEFTTALGKFDAARDAQARNRKMDAAVAQMEGHDAMAKAAFVTADAYEKADRIDEANQLIEFGNQHVAEADRIEASLADMTPERGRIRRFLHKLNPFKKRGGGQDEVAVAGQQ